MIVYAHVQDCYLTEGLNSRKNLCHTLIGKVPLTVVDKSVYMVFKFGRILG